MFFFFQEGLAPKFEKCIECETQTRVGVEQDIVLVQLDYTLVEFNLI